MMLSIQSGTPPGKERDMEQRHLNPPIRALLWVVLLAISNGQLAEVGGAGGTPEKKKILVDPAPPVLQKLPNMGPPAPEPHPDVQFHNQPKPLPIGAVTHDWKSFLGPTHN